MMTKPRRKAESATAALVVERFLVLRADRDLWRATTRKVYELLLEKQYTEAKSLIEDIDVDGGG